MRLCSVKIKLLRQIIKKAFLQALFSLVIEPKNVDRLDTKSLAQLNVYLTARKSISMQTSFH